MCSEMIQAHVLELGGRVILTLPGLPQSYRVCYGTAAPAPDPNKTHLFCKLLRQRVSISSLKNIMYSIGINKLRLFSQPETACSEKINLNNLMYIYKKPLGTLARSSPFVATVAYSRPPLLSLPRDVHVPGARRGGCCASVPMMESKGGACIARQDKAQKASW